MTEFYDDVQQRIEVSYVWGDPRETFLWGCRLAQEAYTERGLEVFKTCAGKGNFLKGYNGEECIFVSGLLEQDVSAHEFARLLNGVTSPRFENVNLGNVKAIIFTARKMPLDWNFHYDDEYIDMLDFYGDITRLCEVRRKDNIHANILEYEVQRGSRPTHITLNEHVVLDGYSLLRDKSRGEYFEKLPIRDLISGDELEKTELINELVHISDYEKRKLCAILEAHYDPVPCDRVRKFVRKLDDFYYLPYIHNFRDFGCYYIFDVKKDKALMTHSLYFDFEAYGADMDYTKPGVEIHMEHVTKFGYICGIDSMGYYPTFDDE